MSRALIPSLLSILCFATACGLPEGDDDFVDPEVHVAGPDEDKADAVRIPFLLVGHPDFAVSAAKLAVETRRVFRTETSYRSFLGASAPRIDFTRNWAVFYTPGVQNLESGSLATISRLNTTTTGKTLNVTTRHVTPGSCPPEATRPFALASFAIPAGKPKTTRYYKDDAPRSCAAAGTYEGVAFTAEQAIAALRLVNDESSGVLTAEIGLDSRAAAGIIAARPIPTMAALAAASYVGAVAMSKLKSYVVLRTNPARPCRGTAMCAAGLRCMGIPNDGSSEEGICRDLTNPPGAGEDCSRTRACGSGLVCAGISRWETGNCVPAWMAARFENKTVRSITATSTAAAPVVTGVVVTGQASVPVDVVVELDLRHSDPASLRVTLADPNGDEGVVFDGPAARGAPLPTRVVVTSGISGDDQVNGRWLLKVVNLHGRGAGTLHSWTLDLTSRFD